MRFASLVIGVFIVACGEPSSSEDASTSDAIVRCTTDESCSDGLFCNGAEQCTAEGQCVPSRSARCLASQQCDENAEVCLSSCGDNGGDADGDGEPAVNCGGNDCDDADRGRFPGNVERCDLEQYDEDCDPTTFGTTDRDGDTYIDAQCCNRTNAGMQHCGNDCDDARAEVHPTEAESCDGLDNDCDGRSDEGVSMMFWVDADGDGYGSSTAAPMSLCTSQAGFSSNDLDCNDTSRSVNPAAPEVCDAFGDNDCDPSANRFDADGDGYDASTCGGSDCDDSNNEIYPGHADEDGDGHHRMDCGGDDCDDAQRSVYPGAEEVCDLLDNDCSAGGGAARQEDADGDGYGSASVCSTGPLGSGDCDDNNEVFHPNAPVDCGRTEDRDCNPATVASSCSTFGAWQPFLYARGAVVAPDGALDDEGNLSVVLTGDYHPWGVVDEALLRPTGERVLASFDRRGALRWKRTLGRAQSRAIGTETAPRFSADGNELVLAISSDPALALLPGAVRTVALLRVSASDGRVLGGIYTDGLVPYTVHRIGSDWLTCGEQIGASRLTGCMRVTDSGVEVWHRELPGLATAVATSEGAIAMSRDGIWLVSSAGGEVYKPFARPWNINGNLFARDGRFFALLGVNAPDIFDGQTIRWSGLFSWTPSGTDLRVRIPTAFFGSPLWYADRLLDSQSLAETTVLTSPRLVDGAYVLHGEPVASSPTVAYARFRSIAGPVNYGTPWDEETGRLTLGLVATRP